MRETHEHALSLMPVESELPGPIEVTHLERLVGLLYGSFKTAIFALPVVHEFGDCLLAASCLDGVVLVVQANHTRSEAVSRTLRQLKTNDANVLGVVLNKCEHLQLRPAW